MEFVAIPPTGIKVLRALNEYRYLTTAQMIRLGVATDRGNLGKVLGGMVSAKRKGESIPRPKEIGMLDFGTLPGVGRLSRLYFLAPKGAEALELAERGGATPIPIKRAVRFQNDYFHRVHTVDFHITLSLFAAAAGHEVAMVRQYFNWWSKEGKRPARPSTSIDLQPGYIDPDSIFRLVAPDGTERLLLVEIANGHRVDRVASKMIEYSQVIEDGRINETFKFDKGVRVLWLFEHRRTMELVQERLAGDPWVKDYEPHFFLRTLNNCTEETFVPNWERPKISGGMVDLF